MPDIETSAPALFRGMLRDIVACSDYDEVCLLLGLVPAGPDVDEIEHLQSHSRIAQFIPVARQALDHADVAANVLCRLTHLNADGEETTDERALAMFLFVARAASTAVISHLLESGTLEIGEDS
ncbi:hypothetical protein ACWD7Y_04260 [Streptomyces drozdowiczii]